MPTSVLAVVVDCLEPHATADFWAKVLASSIEERNPDEVLVRDPSGTVPLYFMRVPEPKVGKNRLHIDVVTGGDLEAEVDRLVSLGAHLVEVRQDPDTFDNPDRWAVLEDPEGNVFCASSRTTITGW